MNAFGKNLSGKNNDEEIISDYDLFDEIKDIKNNIKDFNTLQTHQGGYFDQTNVLDGAILKGGGPPDGVESNTAVDTNVGTNMPQISIDSGFGRPYALASRTGLDSIPAGLSLYHGSKTKETFDVTKINLSTEKDISMCIFSSHINLALSSIGSCAPLGGNGFVHEFRIKRDIPGLYVMSSHELQNKTINDLHKSYCGSNDGQTYNGIMFYVDDINLRKLTGENPDLGSNIERIEVGLCRPHDWLEYVKTIRCIGPRNLSEPYNFNGTRPSASSMASPGALVPSNFTLHEPSVDDVAITVVSN